MHNLNFWTEKMLLLGIDIGTTGCKVIVARPDGKIVAQGYREYRVHRPRPGWVELDGEYLWNLVVSLLRDTNDRVEAEKIQGIGISSQGETVIPVNREGKCLWRAISWTDRRTEGWDRWWRREFGDWEVYRITGLPLSPPIYTINKIMWFRKNKENIYRKTWKFLCMEDYIIFRLTGVAVTDYSIACRTMTLDLRRQKRSTEILQAAKIDETLLPDICPSGTPVGKIETEIARRTGLPSKALVTTGGHDRPCAALAAGVTREGPTLDDTGTAEILAVATQRPILTRKLMEGGFPAEPHVIKGMFLTLSGVLSSGALLKWFRDQFGEKEKEISKKEAVDPYDVMMREASNSKPGASGLMLLPHFAGAFTPHLDPESRGVLLGLRLSHTREDVIRALVEGATFEVRSCIEYQEREGIKISEVRATGGGAKSEFWLQLKANIFDKKVVAPYATESSPLGATMLAGVGTGVYKDVEESVKKIYRAKSKYLPQEDIVREYTRLYEIWRELYPNLESLLHLVSGSFAPKRAVSKAI